MGDKDDLVPLLQRKDGSMVRTVHQRGERLLLPIDDFLASADSDSRLVFLSDQDVTLIRAALWPELTWETRIVRPIEGDLYETSTDEEYQQVQEALNLLDYKLVGSKLMTLESAIMYLADTLASAYLGRPCCPSDVNVNIVQGSTPGGDIIYGTGEGVASTGDPETDPPPEGFEDWESFFTHKCQIANTIVDGVIDTLGNLSFVSIVNATVLGTLIGAAWVGIIALPVAFIPVAGAALVALGVSIGVLNDVAGYLADNREELVCGLYEADNYAAAADFFMSVIDEALSALAVASSLHPAIRTLALLLASTDTINQLWDAQLTISYPDADCSGCGPSCDLDSIVIYNDGTDDWGAIDSDVTVGSQRTITGHMTSVGGLYRFGLTTGVDSGCCWVIDEINDWLNTGNPLSGNRYDCEGQEISESWSTSAATIALLLDDTPITAFRVGYEFGAGDTITVVLSMAA